MCVDTCVALHVGPFIIARRHIYRAFRELGRVGRTLFLLRYISNTEVRRVIRAETTKIETYNELLDWVSFGGPVIKSGPDGGGLASSSSSSSSASRLCQWASATCRVCYGPSRKLSAVPIAPLRSARSGRTRARTRTPISTASRCCARPTAGREDVIVPSA